MSKPVPPIFKYMSTSPHTIDAGDTIADASKTMATHRIRHLPVLAREKVVGIISQRDIAVIETLAGVDPKVVTVAQAMSTSPYVADAETPVTAVAAEMAEKKYGAAIIVQSGRVVGIFTAVDACRTLAEVFETRLK